MIRQLIVHTALAAAVAVGFAISSGTCQAAFISHHAYAYTTVSYDQGTADSLGIFNMGYGEQFSAAAAAHSGDAYAVESRFIYAPGPTEGRAYLFSTGYARADAGMPSSSESAWAWAAGYLALYNPHSYDVLFPITTYHEDYAEAYSDAEYSGYAYSASTSTVAIMNMYGRFTTESWYAVAISSGTYGLSGPFKTADTFHYEVVLTPGSNKIFVEAFVEGNGFVAVPAAVPEPSSLTLGILGLVSFVGRVWWKRRMTG